MPTCIDDTPSALLVQSKVGQKRRSVQLQKDNNVTSMCASAEAAAICYLQHLQECKRFVACMLICIYFKVE